GTKGCTTVSWQAPLSLVPAPEYLEYLAPFDDDIPAENQPLPADASPTARLPGYIADSEPIEDDSEDDPEMDLVDYPSDEEEEEPSASTDLASPVPDSVPSSEETEPFEEAIEACIAEYGSAPTPQLPPPSPLTSLSSPLNQILSPPLLPYQSPEPRARFTALSQRFKIRESSAAAAARQPGHRQNSKEFYTRHQDAQDDRAILQAHISTLARERRYYRHMAIVADREAMLRPEYYSSRGEMTMTCGLEPLDASRR
ncbi:hypothetical protein Tco_1373408, partial [Tanacetum coccineum]